MDKNKNRNDENRGNGQKERGGASSRSGQGMTDVQRASSGLPSSRGTSEIAGRVQSPFALMSQLSREMDRIFDDFWGAPLGRSTARAGRELGSGLWAPAIELHEHDGELVVRADLPGLTRDDVKVDVTDDALTIQGERKQECDAESGGWHHTECRYGSFFRSIPLPEGVDPDQVRAEFESGVLTVRMPAPPQKKDRRRNIEVRDRGETSESRR